MSSSSPPAPTKWVGVSSRGMAYEIVTMVFVSLAVIAVLLRVIARLKFVRKLLVDDYLCITALVFGCGLYPVAILLTEKAAMGWQVVLVPYAQLEMFLQLFFVAELIYGLTSLFYKLAVIFLYRNIFGEIRSFNITSWVMTGITIAWYLGGMFSTVFQCTPIAKTWNQLLPGTCINTDAYILGNGIVNLVIDVVILLTPIPMIWNLGLSLRKKLAIIGVFMIGAVVCIASIFRITTLVNINLADPTYSLLDVSIWSVVELTMGIIAACLPTLRQLIFRRHSDRSGHGYEQYSSNRSQLESFDKSQTAMALTGWNANSTETYTEDKYSLSNPRTPVIQHHPSGNFAMDNFATSFLDTDPYSGGSDEGDAVDDKSITVKKEISVVIQR